MWGCYSDCVLPKGQTGLFKRELKEAGAVRQVSLYPIGPPRWWEPLSEKVQNVGRLEPRLRLHFLYISCFLNCTFWKKYLRVAVHEFLLLAYNHKKG